MKLGLYGGGFKPFHAGHFAKLRLALEENNQIFLLFGITRQRYSTSKRNFGKPLKTQYRTFGSGPDAREYVQPMQELVFDIYERELEKVYDKLEVLNVMGSPIMEINKTLDLYAANIANEGNVALVIANTPYTNVQLGNVDQINVYAGDEEIANQYIGPINSRADKGNEIGQILKELVESGIINFISDYYPGTDEDFIVTHGTEIRSYLESDEETFRRFLPDITGNASRDTEIKDEIISALRDTYDISQRDTLGSVQESFFMPIITDTTIARAAARFTSQQIVEEMSEPVSDTTPSKPGREAHIYPLYEPQAIKDAAGKTIGWKWLPLSDIVEIGRLALGAELENIQEKMDGQYFGFTVINGELKIFTKQSLITDADLNKFLVKLQDEENPTGMNLAAMEAKYSKDSVSGIRESFKVAYEAIEPVALPYQDSLFRNGEVIVTAQVLYGASRNTIVYDENSLRFISPVSLTPDIDVDYSAYDEFVSLARESSTEAFKLDTTPIPQLMAGLERDDAEIAEIEESLLGLLGEYGLDLSNTVGDYVEIAISRLISDRYEFLIPYADIIATRFSLGKSALSSVPKGEIRNKFKKINDIRRPLVDEAIIPLENIIQKLGIMVIDKLDLALDASNRDDLIGFVQTARNAFESGFDFGLGDDDSNVLEKIRVALDRIVENEEYFKIATEGIVFTYQGKTYKLTGLFTPINKLRGFFAYGPASLPEAEVESGLTDKEIEAINEVLRNLSRRLIREGGNAFKHPTEKDEKGKPRVVTSSDKMSRDVAERIIADLKTNVFDGLGLGVEKESFGRGGSTRNTARGSQEMYVGTDSLGDIDLIIKAPEDIMRKMIDDTYEEAVEFRNPNRIEVPPLVKNPSKEYKTTRSNLMSKVRSMTKRIETVKTDQPSDKLGKEFRDALYITLRDHPYFQPSVHPGIPENVILPSEIIFLAVKDDSMEEPVQVDVLLSHPDVSLEDTEFELAGGGQGSVKGTYRNLIFGLLAKIIGEQESNETGRNVKITVRNPGGYTKRVEGEDTIRVRDPDDYLPMIGVDAGKNNLWSYEDLVDYMRSKKDDPDTSWCSDWDIQGDSGCTLSRGELFSMVLDRFKDYIPGYLPPDKTQLALDYMFGEISESAAAELNFRNMVRHLINEEAGGGEKSSFPFTKITWSDKLKIFSSGKWNLWNERTSAKADGGHDPEGAEKAVAAMENLIYLSGKGYGFVKQEDGGVLIHGEGINAKLDADEAVEYIIGIRTSQDESGPKLPEIRIRHVAGTEPYDLELVDPKTPLEVKKMQSTDKLAKLGSATGRLFDRHVKIIRPLRAAGQIAQRFIESGNIVDSKTGNALIREIENPPEGMDVENVANAVEMIDYLFNKVKYSYSKKELPGIIIKVEGGQIPAGMIAKIKRDDLLNLRDRGNILDLCKKVLNDNLGDYSPAKDKSSLWTASEPWLQSKDDVVDITANAGGAEYEGKVSLEYFYDDLIFRLFDHTKEGVEIDESLILSYTQCMEMISEIYSSFVKINDRQGADAFEEFITKLGEKKYGGFYGVTSNHYYSMPCDTTHLDVYGTTQGFRAVLLMKSIPSEGPSIRDVSFKHTDEEEVDLEVDLLEPESEDEEISNDILDIIDAETGQVYADNKAKADVAIWMAQKEEDGLDYEETDTPDESPDLAAWWVRLKDR